MNLTWRRAYLVLPLLAALGLLVWLHYRLVALPLNYANRDFMSLWAGGKALLLRQNPFDEAVWQPLRAAYGSTWFPDPTAPFPLWTFLFTWPLALLPVNWAAALWLVAGEAALFLSLLALARAFGQARLAPAELGLLALGGFASITTWLVLVTGQMTPFLLAALVAYLLARQRRKPFLAGICLASVLLKPNPFLLFAPLLALWHLLRRQWATLAGWAAGGGLLLTLSWLVLPGWPGDWLAVRAKTAVAITTPTLWGVLAHSGGGAWLPLGLAISALLSAGLGLRLVRQPRLEEAEVLSLALAGSLLITPYAWSYEQALLFIPWLWLFFGPARGKRPRLGWLLFSLGLPWLFFALAVIRGNERLTALVPALTLAALLWPAARPADAGAAPEYQEVTDA